MSQTNDQVKYHFTIQTGNASYYTAGSWEADSNLGMTDEQANAIVQAINAITVPAGVILKATVDKEEVVDTSYTTNYSTNPITFT